jgi:hypothetical protein
VLVGTTVLLWGLATRFWFAAVQDEWQSVSENVAAVYSRVQKMKRARVLCRRVVEPEG